MTGADLKCANGIKNRGLSRVFFPSLHITLLVSFCSWRNKVGEQKPFQSQVAGNSFSRIQQKADGGRWLKLMAAYLLLLYKKPM